jgi:FKBP-type peptidyl-prolyl cis-trans isomerase FkpA
VFDLNKAAAFILTAALVAAPAWAEDAKKDCAPPPKELVKKDLVVGQGDDVVFRTAALVAYTGWVYDGCAKDLKGEQFDTSDGRVTPFGLVVGAGKVIKGWDDGLIGMKPGGKRLLVIPPDQAYGDKSPNPKILPNSTLVFEVSIIKILSGPPPTPAPKAPAAPPK